MIAVAVCTVVLLWLLSVQFSNADHTTFGDGHVDHAASGNGLDPTEKHDTPSLDSQPSTPEIPPKNAVAEPTKPSCGVTKVSMLYGSHKFAQLEAAQELHRTHSERWACGWVSLDRDISSRKLYSKHYILLSIMLQELAKPEESREKWLL